MGTTFVMQIVRRARDNRFYEPIGILESGPMGQSEDQKPDSFANQIERQDRKVRRDVIRRRMLRFAPQ
jgi:hypothetical protein